MQNQTVQFFHTIENLNSETILKWNFGDGFSEIAMNPIHTYTTPGKYVVTLYAITECGISIATQRVMVFNYDPFMR